MAISSKGAIGAELLELADGQGAAVASASTVRIRANAATGKAEVSAFGGSYAAMGAVFGEDYVGASSRARSTTTSAAFQTKTTLATPVMTGNYLVVWHSIVDQSSAASQIEVRLWNVTMGYSMGSWQLVQPTTSIERRYMGGRVGFSLAAASNTFEIQYRALGGNTAGIQDAAIEVWRVS